MTKRKPVFNPQAKYTKKPMNGQKKGTEKRQSLFRFQRKSKEEPNTRTLRFAPRSAQSVLSFCFFGLFLVMCVVVLMTFGRVDTLTRAALSKQVNKEVLIREINQGLQATEQLRYEGTKLVECLLTLSHQEGGREQWEARLTPYLAQGLQADRLGLDTIGVDRKTQTIQLIKLETVDEKEALYRLYYDVSFTEGNVEHQIQLILPISYEGRRIKLIDQPMMTNLASTEDKNQSVYQENRFFPQGEEVSEEDKQNIIEFTQRFFELYVTNDEKLALVATIQGLDHAQLIHVEPKTVMKQTNGNYFVQGTYQFAFEENNPLASQFTLEIQPTKESYFVINMNGVK